MDHDKEITALAAENLALSYVVSHVLSALARNPLLRPAITEGFDHSLDVAESIAVQLGKSASPDHTVKALRIIEEMRAIVLGDVSKPKHGV